MAIQSTPDEVTPPAAGDKGQPFYVTGGTLPPSASSYVERAADAALASALLRGEFSYVLNTRQMGKSSLMARTADDLRRSGAAVVVLDLTAIGQNLTVTQWYYGLLVTIGEQLGLEDATDDYWSEHAAAGPLQRFLGALCDAVLPGTPGDLVVFIDEIDAVRSLPFATDELFAGIRELYNRRTLDPKLGRLTFCLLGVATPADLIRDTRTTPFNIGARIDLNDFTPTEAAPLGRGISGSRTVLDRVLYWTGGHPYLTQRLCRAIADDPVAITRPAQVDALCERLFLSRRARETEDNLLFVRERILRSDADLADLLSLYSRVLRHGSRVPDDPADPLISTLKLAGVVKAGPLNQLQVRNRIYARVFGQPWVLENMPGAELRRQRRAFRRGALRTGAVATLIIIVIGILAGIAIKEAQEARRQSARFERLLYVSDMQNVQTAWDNGNLGRIRELLSQTKNSPERGFEWGYWNTLAYPAGATVQVGTAPLLYCDATRDGTKLLTAGGDGMLRLWDTQTLHQIYGVHYPGTAIVSATFSLDGSRWEANDGSGGLAIFDTASGKQLYRIPTDQTGIFNAGSPDLHFVFRFIHDAGVTFVNVNTGRQYGFLPSRGDNAQSVSGSSVGNTTNRAYWFAQKPFDASIYDMTNGRHICRLQLPSRLRGSLRIRGLFSGDDRTLVTYSWPTCDFDLWDTTSGRLISHLDNVPFANNAFHCIDRYAPIVIIRDGDRLREYSTHTGQRLLDCSYPETSGELSPSSFSHDGRYLGFVGAAGKIFLLDCKTGRSAGTYLGHAEASASMVFLPNGSRFFSISADGSLRRWDRSDSVQQQWHTVHFPKDARYDYMMMMQHETRALLWERTVRNSSWGVRNSLWGVAGDIAQHIRTWIGDHYVFLNKDSTMVTLTPTTGGAYSEYAMDNGRLVGRWTTDRDRSGTAAVSPDGRYLATCATTGMTSVYDRLSDAHVWSARGSNSIMNDLRFSPSGRYLAGGGSDRAVDVWDAPNGRKIASLTGSTGQIVALTVLQGDENLAAACDDQTMRCWDIASGRMLWKIQYPQCAQAFLQLRQSPDGKRLLMTSSTGIVSTWDAETGDQLLKIQAKGPSPDAQFSPDGSTLEITNDAGGYINYAADMRPHTIPASELGGL